MSQKWSEELMDKLAGELSEKEAARFEEETMQDDHLAEDYQFFVNAWEQMDEFQVSQAPTSLSETFYNSLDQTIKSEESSLKRIISEQLKHLLTSSGWVKNLSLGMFLLALGFILGGKWNIKTINVNQTTVHTSDTNTTQASHSNYIPTTQKIASIKSIPLNFSEEEGYIRLKETFQTERNTNLKIAALREIEEHYSGAKDLKSFLSTQLEKEQSPLVQVEMVNLLMNNNQSKETIRTMESMLRRRQLNPVVEEKIRQDLPVLKASFVK